MSAQRKATLDELWEEFRKETDRYRENTEERKLRFEALKKKDEESARTIARQMRKLQKLQVHDHNGSHEALIWDNLASVSE